MASTAGIRPIHRSSQETGGVRTNVSRTAIAIGTSKACAQYRTRTMSTHPAKVTHDFTVMEEFLRDSERSYRR